MNSEDLLTEEEKKELNERLRFEKEEIIKSIIIHRHNYINKNIWHIKIKWLKWITMNHVDLMTI